ncbi:MAG: hypothetical protein VYE40_16640 [Myxococcota bacterium]|nr:hypothetical protein [Myxococcota bacterium]
MSSMIYRTCRIAIFASLALALCVACEPRKKDVSAEQAAGFRVANVASATVIDVAVGDSTYAQIKEAQWTFWIKVEATDLEIKKGDHVLLGKGDALTKHHDKKLDRTFDAVIALTQVKVVTPEESKRFIWLAPPEKDGVAIGDLYAQREELAGKPVAIRGRIVKANKNIFDTNWYHLQDGTGDDETNDLTITSGVDANVGDVVVVRGPLSVDHSLGFGYDYDAILLDASLTVEERAEQAPGGESGESIPRELIADTVSKGAPSTSESESATTPTPHAKTPQKKNDEIKKVVKRDWAKIRAKTESKKPKLGKPLEELEVLGLELGRSDDEAIKAWLGARQIDCEGQNNAMRESFSYDCHQGLASAQLSERDADSGQLERVMLSHADKAPLGLFSLTHRFSIPGHAFATYEARKKMFEEKFGAPSSEKEVSEESFEKAKIGRYATVWNFDNVEVSVVLYSIQGTMRVIERWDLKSDAARHAQRPDAKPVHGSGIKPTPNPHIKRTEST